MTLFTIIRMIFLVIFVLLNTAILAAAAVNLATLASPDVLRPIEAFQVFYTTLSILFLFPVILIDVLRTGSLASKVWFECAWLAAAALFNLVAAAASTGTLSKCSATDPNCSAGAHVLLPITWVATLVVSAQLALIGISATFYSKRYPDVWSASVRDFAWFSGGGAGKGSSLESGPPTPNFIPKKLDLAGPQLESMTERWAATQRRVSVLQSSSKSKVATEPQPLTLEYAPELPYTRAPVHYNASAAISVGVLPQRKPSQTRKPAPALYPTAVQIAINATSPTKPTSAATLPPSEPLPIRNWPRANPLESTMKEKIAPVSIPAPPPSNPLSPVSRRSKHRPPPLDLSAALPSKHRK